MNSGEKVIEVRKLDKTHKLKITVKFTQEFNLRFKLACVLMELAAFILGCSIAIEKSEQDK